jgi:hypothetical protein
MNESILGVVVRQPEYANIQGVEAVREWVLGQLMQVSTQQYLRSNFKLKQRLDQRELLVQVGHVIYGRNGF